MLKDMLDDLENQFDKYDDKLQLISFLIRNDRFKLLSKQARNSIMYGILDDVAQLEEMTKIMFRALKKVKRERVPEDVIDSLLGFPEEIRNANLHSEDSTSEASSDESSDLEQAQGS